MLVTMSQKELNRIPVLQQVCDKLLTQSAAVKLLNLGELIQIGGSRHDWFEGRTSKCVDLH